MTQKALVIQMILEFIILKHAPGPNFYELKIYLHEVPATTFFFLPAPLHSPVPIEMFNTSSTSLRATWGEVPDAYHHGEVMGYRVFLEETAFPDIIVSSGTFPLDVNTTDLTGLKKFTSYTVRIRAYSFFGEGPDGVVTTLTDEDSERYCFD